MRWASNIRNHLANCLKARQRKARLSFDNHLIKWEQLRQYENGAPLRHNSNEMPDEAKFK